MPESEPDEPGEEPLDASEGSAPARLKSIDETPIRSVLVTGASGFLGRNVCAALVNAGYGVIGLVRRLPKPDDLQDGVVYELGDVTRASSLSADVFARADAVIHLVGIIVELRGAGQTFSSVHVHGTENVVRAASDAGTVRKLIYVSALGASLTSKSEYARTKAMAESAVTRSEIRYTIFRPSIILGKSGDFVRQIEALIKRPPLCPVPLPFIPVPGSGKNLFQPVHIDDLTACLIRSLDNDDANAHIYEIGGANTVTFNALIEAFAHRLNIRKRLLHIPTPLLFVAASVLEALMPNPPVTVDQLINLRIDNVCDNTAVAETFSVAPRSFEESLELI